VPSPVAPVVELSEGERAQLVAWSRRAKSANALAMRSRIVLAAADGLSTTAIAARLGIALSSARKWRSRFVTDRLDGLLDEPRPGRPRTVSDEQVEAVITRTLETTPKDATHWSTRSLAAELGLSQSAVSRIWRAFGLQPHRQDAWKLSRDPQFIDKVRDVVGLYLDPPEAAVVLCVDEKSQIQALDRTAPMLPMQPGLPERRTHDYKRHGTSTLFAALEISTGKVTGACKPRHRHQEFLAFLKQVARAYPEGELHLVMDNYAAHKKVEVRDWLTANPRIHVHFTPTSGSWLNLVEVWFGIIERQAIHRGSFGSVKELNAKIRAFIDGWNDRCHPFVWTNTADEILKKANRQTTSNTAH
jgi:transposase